MYFFVYMNIVWPIKIFIEHEQKWLYEVSTQYGFRYIETMIFHIPILFAWEKSTCKRSDTKMLPTIKWIKDIFNLYDHIHFLAIHNRYILCSFCKCFQFPASFILFEISHFIVGECTIFVQLDLIIEALAYRHAFGQISCLSKTLLSALRTRFIKSTPYN